jgi:ADP-heptose:LPS heptosyltransferase
MINVLERLSPGARVAVIRLRSLGDCVLTTPAISLLKQARPDLRIAMVVEDAFAPVFAGNPDLESILPPRASEISRWRPELTVNLHGGATSVRLTIASRSRWRAGFAHFRFRPVYNIQIPRAQEILHVDRKVHTAEHVASAMFYLGVPQTEIPRARLFAKPQQSVRPYAVLHPMASAPDKTWPSSNFLAVAEHLDKRFGLEPVFIAGPGESIDAFAQYRTLAGAPLEAIKSLLSGASLFVGNDSGPAHMAAAFGLPVMVLFGSSDPEIWRPWRTESSVLTNPAGIHSVGTAEVVQAIETVLVPQPASHFPPPR